MTRRVLIIVLTVCLTLSAATAWAFWTAGSVAGGNGASAVSSVNQGATPTATAVARAVTVRWAASTLTSGQPVTKYQVKRYDAGTLLPQTILSSCTDTIPATTCVENSVPAGSWKYAITPVFANNWLGLESALSTTVIVDPTPPTNSITLSGVSGAAYKSGTTVFYRGEAIGSFTLTNAVTDADSGPASSQTATLGNTPTSWSHLPSTVTTPAGGPYVSNSFSWAAGATSSPSEVVTGRDAVGNTTPTNLSFVNDSTDPTAGTITYTDGYQAGASVGVAFTTGKDDDGSGIATRQLQRAIAALTNGICATFGAFTNLGADSPASPYTDSQVSAGVCYMYRYVVTDRLGNQHTAKSDNVAKIDYAGVVTSTPGLLSLWRLGEASATLRAADSKGSNTGDYRNGPTLGVPGALVGDTNTAAQFDGVNDFVQMTGTIGLPTGAASRSVEAWFLTSTGTRQVLFNYGNRANTQEFGLWLDAGGTAMTAWGFGGGNDKTFTMPSAVNNGQWHQVVETYNGTLITLYIDGVALPAQAASRATTIDQYGFSIGAVLAPNDSNSGGYFKGSIDEVSFYTTTLNQATVTNHFALGKLPLADTTGPTGGSVDATGLVGTGARYAASTALSLNLVKGSDLTGLATTGHLLMRATATLTSGGTCGAFGSYATVATDPVSPTSDTVSDQACYRYQYVVLDSLGNTAVFTSLDIKVDLTAPSAPSLGHGTFTNTYWSSGASVYYRSSAPSGSFTTTATATDAASGISGYVFPSLGVNWTVTGTGAVRTYSWTTGPEAPGTRSVTATNNAGIASGTSLLALIADDTAPTAGSVTPPNTTQTSTSVNVEFVTGTDTGGSGVGTRLLQRQSAPLTGTTCGSFPAADTGWTTVSTNPGSSPFSDTTVTAGSCYQYQYVVADNVGNQTTANSPKRVKVITACGAELLVTPGFENGATAWTASSGVVTSGGARTGESKALLGGSSNATETVAQNVTIPSYCAGTVTLTYWLRVTTNENYNAQANDLFSVEVTSGATTTTLPPKYSNRDSGTDYVQRTVDLSAYAGQTITLRFVSVQSWWSSTSFFLDDVSLKTTEDITGPAGVLVDASGLVGTGARYAASTTLSLDLVKGTDTNGVAATNNVLKRATATLASGDGTCGAFGSYTTLATDPVSPTLDTVSDQTCYRYQYVVLDSLGNAETDTSLDIKVDLTAPSAPSLAHGTFTNTYWSSGASVYYRSLATSGSFKSTATATDAASGISGYVFPSLGVNWTVTGTGSVRTYSWSTGPEAPGTRFVTATNNAGIASATSPLTLTADDTAPSAGSVTPPATTQTSSSVSVEFVTGTDTGSGVGTRLLRRQSASLTGTTCGSFPAADAGWTTAATNPDPSSFTDTVTRGACYKYQYVVADKVGNLATATSPTEVKVTPNTAYLNAVSGTPNLVNYYRLGEGSGTTMVDVKGTTTGAYVNSPTIGVAGATGDSNTAVQFNGTSQYGTVARPVDGDFSIEFWFKSTQNYSNGDCSNWWQGAGLIDADLNGTADDFGISLCSGKVVAGVGGSPDKSIASPLSYRDGTWHHVVFTRIQSSGAMKLFVDGAEVGTVTGSVNLLQSVPTINIGRSARGDQYYEGSMDEIAFYKAALSSTTVSAHFSAR